MRRNTQLSYDLSHTAVATVLTQLKDNIPALGVVMDNILDTLIQHKVRCRRDQNRCLLHNYNQFINLNSKIETFSLHEKILNKAIFLYIFNY